MKKAALVFLLLLCFIVPMYYSPGLQAESDENYAAAQVLLGQAPSGQVPGSGKKIPAEKISTAEPSATTAKDRPVEAAPKVSPQKPPKKSPKKSPKESPKEVTPPKAGPAPSSRKTITRAKPGPDKFFVKVGISDQTVSVYKNGVKLREIPCSTGITGKETPTGSFKINGYSGLSFYNPKYGQGARYWVGFINAKYLFHSVPIDEKGRYIKEEAEKIGTPASHGCIRLPVEDSIWFYETVPQGTDVVIHG